MLNNTIGLVLLLALVGASLLAVRVGRNGWTTVHAWDFGVAYARGRFEGVLEPGRYLTFGGWRTIFAIRRTEQVLETPLVDVLSSDRLPLRLQAHVTYRVTDPRFAFENEHVAMITFAARTALVALAAERTLDEIMSGRVQLGGPLLELVGPRVCGCDVLGVAIGDLVLPPEIRRLLSEAERARLEGVAALERARGEQAALRSLANSARMLKGNPELMNLRLLQALSGGGRGQPTLVLGSDALLPVSRPEAGGSPDDGAGA